MHSKCVRTADAADNIAEDKASSVGVDLDPNNVLILDAHLFGIFRSHVDVAFRNDDALFQLNFAAGANQFAGCGSSQIAGFTDGRNDAQRARVGKGNLDLIRFSFRTQDGTFQRAFGADNGDFLFAGELAGLRKIFLIMQNCVCAEQDSERLFGNVNVSCGSLNDKLFSHRSDHSFLMYKNAFSAKGNRFQFYYNPLCAKLQEKVS